MKYAVIAMLLASALVVTAREGQNRNAYGVRGTAPAQIGNAVDLDGSTEYFSDNTATNLASGWTNITVGCWFFSNVKLNAGLVVSRGPSYYVMISLSSTTADFLPNGVIASSASYSTGVWNFACGTWIKGERGYLYFNGVRTQSGVNNSALGCDDVFRIGKDDFNESRYFNGKIDEAFIFNRSLTSNEVVELYNNGASKSVNQLSTGTNGLVRLWHLDESGSASNAYDSASGTTATGTAIGTGDWVPGKVPLP
jgi:hypothetical protein